MKQWKIVMMVLLAGASAMAQGGNGAGNGGDDLEQESQAIVRDIHTWIIRGGWRELKEAPEDYDRRMLAILDKKVVIEFMGAEKFIEAYGVEKVCSNHDLNVEYLPIPRQQQQRDQGFQKELRRRYEHNESVRARIVALGTPYLIRCNREAYPAGEEARYRLLHHEIAGLAGIEHNKGDAKSDYYLSDQVSAFLEEVVVKRLPMRSAVSSPMSDKTFGNNGLFCSSGDFFGAYIPFETFNTLIAPDGKLVVFRYRVRRVAIISNVVIKKAEIDVLHRGKVRVAARERGIPGLDFHEPTGEFTRLMLSFEKDLRTESVFENGMPGGALKRKVGRLFYWHGQAQVNKRSELQRVIKAGYDGFVSCLGMNEALTAPGFLRARLSVPASIFTDNRTRYVVYPDPAVNQ